MTGFAICDCGNFERHEDLPKFCNNCGGLEPMKSEE